MKRFAYIASSMLLSASAFAGSGLNDVFYLRGTAPVDSKVVVKLNIAATNRWMPDCNDLCILGGPFCEEGIEERGWSPKRMNLSYEAPVRNGQYSIREDLVADMTAEWEDIDDSWLGWAYKDVVKCDFQIQTAEVTLLPGTTQVLVPAPVKGEGVEQQEFHQGSHQDQEFVQDYDQEQRFDQSEQLGPVYETLNVGMKRVFLTHQDEVRKEYVSAVSPNTHAAVDFNEIDVLEIDF